MHTDTLSHTNVNDSAQAHTNVVAWEKTTPKGVVIAHATVTATGLIQAPKAVQVQAAQSADLRQLNNGNFAPVREALALFKGKERAAIVAHVTQALSIVDGEGNPLAPIVPYDNVRSKTHAMAIARAIAALPALKGRKAQWRALFAEWAQ